MIELRQWQKESYDNWHKNGYWGIIKARTGAGKTKTGVACASRFKQDYPLSNVLIVVPSQKIISQWKAEMREQLVDVPVMTYMQAINQMYRGGLKVDCLILDECHRIAPDKQSAKIMNLNPQFVLGLSATPGGSVRTLGNPFYTVDWEDANLCPFYVHYARFKPTQYEMQEYRKWSDNMKKLALDMTGSRQSSLAPGRSKRYDFFVRTRRGACYSFPSRVGHAVNLIKTYKGKRTVVYVERNDMIDDIAKELDKEGIGYAICNQRQNTLSKFENHQVDVLLLAKMMREGWNDVTLEVEILVAPTTRELSHTQVVGRVQRRDPDNPDKVAHIIVLIAEGTSDESILRTNDFPTSSVESTTIGAILEIAPGVSDRQMVTKLI